MTRNEIVQATDMRELCERYGVQVNKQGYARCCFHSEKTASMKIYKHDFHCFGCGKGGSVFDFVMKMEGCNFKQAFEILGGTFEKPTGTMLAKQYRAKQKAERDRQALQEALRRAFDAAARVCTIKTVLKLYEPLSVEWCIAIKDLSYFEGMADMYMDEYYELKNKDKLC